jgi:hypothetical protein
LVVSNFFHFRMMEATVFLETFNAADIFWYPSPDLCRQDAPEWNKVILFFYLNTFAQIPKPVFALSLWGIVCRFMRKGVWILSECPVCLGHVEILQITVPNCNENATISPFMSAGKNEFGPSNISPLV